MGLVQQLEFTPPRPNLLNRGIWRFSSSKFGAWLFSKILHHVDLFLARVSKGKVTMAGSVGGLPLITLISTGAKSGQRRESPLLGIPIGDDIAIIGTHFGQPGTPNWWFNLKANPDVEVTYQGRTAPAVAREIRPDERQPIWEKACATYIGYAAYERRIHDRPINIAVLEPR